MLINYLKAALASWYRRKIFTALTLLAMALSIIILTCIATFWALLNSPRSPESNKEQLRIVTPEIWETKSGRQMRWFEIDNLMTEEWKNYDYSQLGVKEYTAFSGMRNWSLIINQNQYESYLPLLNTDQYFFNVFDFTFISGSGYDNRPVTDEGIPVVIVRSAAEKLFGTTQCIGKTFTGNYEKLLVTGVVESTGPWSLFFIYDIFMLRDFKGKSEMVNIAFQISGGNELPFFQRKLGELANHISSTLDGHTLTLEPMDFVEAYATIRQMRNILDPKTFIPLIIIIILLPVICMVNLFNSMMMERTEELGIRKSFGAPAKQISFQFVVESVMFTVIAGFFALLFSILCWKYLLELDLGTVIREVFTWRVFAFCLASFLFIGALVGYFSSVKLAKGSIVKYLSLNNQ